MSKKLIQKTYYVAGTWYAPQEYLEHFISVKRVALMNTTSSAGDWDGLFVQRMNSSSYSVIEFSQTNVFGGFNLYTGREVARYNEMPTDEQLTNLYNRLTTYAS